MLLQQALLVHIWLSTGFVNRYESDHEVRQYVVGTLLGSEQ